MTKPLDKKSQASVTEITKKQQEEKEGEQKRLIGKDFDAKMVDLLKKGRTDLEQIKKDRAALSTKKAAILAKWSAKGLNTDAIIDAANYCEKTEEQKGNYDVSYSWGREVFGDPVQIDMFEESVKAEIREKTGAK